MEFELTESQKMLQNTVREFVEKEITKEYCRRWDTNHETMDWLDQRIRIKGIELGLFCIAVPKEYGGLGGGMVDEVIIVEQVARRSPTAAFSVGGRMFVELIMQYGTEEQKNEYLPKMANGTIGFAIAITEPAGGTDVLGAMSTTAVSNGDNFIINGQKIYITGAHRADFICTLAITDRNQPKRSKAVSLLFVDRKSKGLEVKPLNKLSMRGAGTNEVFYADVRVPRENLIGELNKGFYQLVSLLNPERIFCAATTVGLAQGAFEDALEYAKSRMAFGKPIGQFQIIQHWLADMAIEIEMGRLMTYKAAWLLDQGKPAYLEAAAAKVCTSEIAVKTTTNAMEIFAGAGVMMETDIQRYFRDARQFTFAPISNEMARNFIGELMGLPRSF
ncbi:MAG: acyl-CoA/acyl-ACP dehydrogenase [Dehalococcoidia bacterium]|nr:acyl-CoA/acyl-ACP dehydrogenase [Dehalococcoidia bacterium]MDD5493477.1 acyl-CoA/acyl-ACP dehydrogenase [Dehalococcoidia bacterium]